MKNGNVVKVNNVKLTGSDVKDDTVVEKEAV